MRPWDLISTGRKRYPCFYNEKGHKKIFRKVKKKKRKPDQSKSPGHGIYRTCLAGFHELTY